LKGATQKINHGGMSMIESLKALLRSWNEATRSITLEFVNELSDADLDKKLPRKHLNTIRMQLEEMAQIQKEFIDAINTKVLDFKEMVLENKSKQDLVKEMTTLDKALEQALEPLDGTEIISGYGEQWNVHELVSRMIIHENMHIGQIIAFCYATGLEIPATISEPLALEG